MPGLRKRVLHARILTALECSAFGPAIDDVPLVVSVPRVASPLAIWAFTLTNPPGGRHPAESKIQLIMRGQRPKQHANFEGPVGHFKLLIGVHPTDNLFVLWDAYKQVDFCYSKNVQVQGPLLWDASVSGLSSGTRDLEKGSETVIVARADKLVAAIVRRIEAE